MNHLSEEDLVLHYYGEAADPLPLDRHLQECEACRAAYGSLQRVLNVVETWPNPERSATYGAEVWERLSPYLPLRRQWRFLTSPWRWAATGAAFATLIAGAFLAGRFYTRPPAPAVQIQIAADPEAGQRLLTFAVGDYLERSQVVLMELANANAAGPLDISGEQQRVARLLDENRLYRQTALHMGDGLVAGVLDELERRLLDIAHAPSHLAPAQVDDLRRRLREDGILFKIRVLGSTVRNRDDHRL